jgi:transglutaminase-like putative cysteine protease/tetratricopeptide (TPR) repeat protein
VSFHYRIAVVFKVFLIFFLAAYSDLAAISAAYAQSLAIPSAEPRPVTDKSAENAFTRNVPIPDWVDSIASIPPAQTSGPIVLRLADAYFYVDRQPSVFVRRAVQVNDASALGQIGQIEISFQPDYQQVQLHTLRILRGDQIIDKQADADIRFLRREPQLDAGVYGGAVTAAIVVNDVRVGDTLEFAYTTIGKNPVFGQRFSDAATWDIPYPTLRRRVTLNAPEDRHIKYRVIGADQKAVLKANESHVAGRRIVRFDANDLPVVDFEQYTPKDYQAMRWIQFSEFDSWHDVAGWANELFSATASPASLGEALSAARGAKSQREAVVKALEYVQNNIRYLSVSLGENSHRPYPPEQVLARRYGDCKDKSLLLVAMLRQLGIDAAPVLVSVSNQKGLDQLLPSPLLFDHAIVRAIVAGKTYYLDPTRLGQTGDLDQLGQQLTDSQVLVITPSTDKLSMIPPQANDELITNTRTERIDVVQMDAPVQMSVKLSYAGTYAEGLREAVAKLTAEQLRKYYEGNVGQRYPEAVLVGDPVITDDRSNNHVAVDLQFRIPHLFEAGNGQWSMKYQPDNLRGLFYPSANTHRRTPLAVPSFPSINRYRLEVNLPEIFDGHYVPSHTNQENSVFSLSKSAGFAGRQIVLEQALQIKFDRVAAGDVPVFLSDLNKMGESLQGSLIVRQTDLKTASPVVVTPAAFKQVVVERLRKTIDGTTQAIEDARLSGRDPGAALCERAKAEAYLSRFGDVLKDMREAAQLQPNAGSTLRCQAEVDLTQGNYKSAEEYFSRAMAQGISDGDIYLRRGIANYYLGKFGAAAGDFSRSVGLAPNPADKTRAAIWRVLAQARNGVAPDAATMPNMADSPEWLNAALAMLLKQQKPEMMLSLVHKQSGEGLEVALAEAYFHIGQYYLLAGDKPRANAYFQQSADKGVLYNPYYSAARLELARLR